MKDYARAAIRCARKSSGFRPMRSRCSGDVMINIFDPDALIVGAGGLEANDEFQRWFIDEIRAALPTQREEENHVPIHVMPNGGTAGALAARQSKR